MGRRATYASGPDNVCTSYFRGWPAVWDVTNTVEFLPGRPIFRNRWNVGNSILFFTLMTGFLPVTFTLKALSRGLVFAPSRVNSHFGDRAVA